MFTGDKAEAENFLRQRDDGAHLRTIYFALYKFTYYPAIRSLDVFVLLYVFLFLFVRFWSTISRQPAGRFTPNFACGRTLVPDVFSPLLGVSGPRGSGKRGE